MQEQEFITFSSPQEPTDEYVSHFKNASVLLKRDYWSQIQDKNPFQSINSWKTEKLKFASIQEKSILRLISHIRFSHLQNIYVEYNKIESIEGLSRVDMLTLQSLTLLENKIVKVSDLRKSKLPKLKHIYLQNNFISDMETFQAFGNKELWDFTVSYFASDKDQCGNKNWIVKLESPCLKELEINSSDKIKMNGVERVLRKKHEAIMINTKK